MWRSLRNAAPINDAAGIFADRAASVKASPIETGSQRRRLGPQRLVIRGNGTTLIDSLIFNVPDNASAAINGRAVGIN